MKEDCIFCAIVAGRAPASLVWRDELVLAFMDIRPVTPGHLLVVPNEHVTDVRDLGEPVGGRLFAVARALARGLLRSGLRADGTNMWVADGEAAGQEVAHAHLHVWPRFAGDGLLIDAAAYRAPAPSREELDEHAATLRAIIEEATEDHG